MQIILASAKIMHDQLKSMPNVDMTKPRFQNEAAAFARDMASYPIETIAEMLGCSQAIATKVIDAKIIIFNIIIIIATVMI